VASFATAAATPAATTAMPASLSAISSVLSVAPRVADALAAGRPVVALESTLITHGFAHPMGVQAARRAEAAVRGGGAEPATVAVCEGRLVVGLAESELEEIALADSPRKASRATLALALADGGWAGTTVSATMIAAALAGVRVFATGGIGGVHRGGAESMDISADLDELAQTPVLVVCAGPKSVLDIDLTLEYLETRGVPVLGWQTTALAGFYARDSGRILAGSVADAADAARVASTHWNLKLASGLLICVPLPVDAALSREDAESAIAQAVADSEAADIHGPAATPFVLARVAALTEGRSVTANLALIENNARVAASIAVAIAAESANRR
jgi:pseudouridylate synthase